MLILKIILKIILILLLVILALLVLLLLMRLNYSITAKYDKEVYAQAKLSVLFGAIKVIYDYGGENEGAKFFLFGKERFKKEEAPNTETEQSFENEDPPPEALYEPQTEVKAEEKSEAKAEEKPKAKAEEKPKEKPKEKTEEKSEAKAEEKPKEKPKAKAEEKPKEKPKAKAEEKPEEKAEEKPEETEQKEKKQRKTKKPKRESALKKLSDGIDKFNRFRERYDIPLLIHNAKIYLGEQIRSIGILGGSLNGILGLGDPSYTGMALGGIGVAGAFAPIDIDIDGDFEKTNIALEGYIYGKTYILRVVMPILRFVFKKPVRTMISDILFKKG